VKGLARWWFVPAPAARLGWMRVVLGAFSLRYLFKRRRMLAGLHRTDPRLYSPVGVARPVPGPLAPAAADALASATLAANVAFLAGWRHRYTGPLYALLLLWTLSYRNSWSMVFHTDNQLVLHALVLGVAPSADAISVDALRARSDAVDPHRPHERYGWPIRLVSTVTTLTYLVSGVAKLAGPMGRRWMAGESLRSQIAVDALRKQLLSDGRLPAAARHLDADPAWRAAAIASMVVELGAPVALLSPRLGRWWALAALGMHYGILAVMDIKFRYQLTGAAFASFFRLERAEVLLRRLVQRT